MGYEVWHHERHFFSESNCWMEVSLSSNQSWCFFCGEAKGSHSSVHDAVGEVCPFSGEFLSIPLLGNRDPGGFAAWHVSLMWHHWYMPDVVWRPSVLGQDRSETPKIGLGLGRPIAGLVLCCETRSCHARRHNDLEKQSNFSSTIYSLSILLLECAWRSTVAFTYLKVKSAKCLCLLPVVLLLVLVL